MERRVISHPLNQLMLLNAGKRVLEEVVAAPPPKKSKAEKKLPKSVTKPAVKVVKAAKAVPAKKILAPTKISDDDDDDGESSDEVCHNTHLQYFLCASATCFVDWNPSH
jgi:hypothetical protein